MLIPAVTLGAVLVSSTMQAESTLKDAFRGDFRVGVAINQRQFDNEDRRGDPVIETQFNAISPENVLKWESVHPQPSQYDFTEADHYVQFGEEIRG